MAQFNFKAIGTTWQIDVYGAISAEEQSILLSQIEKRITLFDEVYSRFRSDSLVTKISKESGDFTFPKDGKKLFSIYYDLYVLTGGFFTPLVGKMLIDSGYDAEYSLKQKKELETPPRWEEVLEYTEPILKVKKPIALDFGAAGKGYLIDLVGKVLEENNINKYCIDAGGDILHKNTEPLRIGLENPDNLEEVIGVCNLGNGSICGSAGNRRRWANFTHIMNPKTLISPTEILAVWVVAKEAIVADALTTCLFFVDPPSLLEKYSFEYLIVRKDHSVEKSHNFPGELFTV